MNLNANSSIESKGTKLVTTKSDQLMSPHAHAHYFESARCNTLGSTAITTQGGNTVININIGNNNQASEISRLIKERNSIGLS